MSNKNPIKDVFEKVGLLSKAAECLDSAKTIYHEHFEHEIKTDEKYKHIATELDEIMKLLDQERDAFNKKVESLEIFKEIKNGTVNKKGGKEE